VAAASRRGSVRARKRAGGGRAELARLRKILLAIPGAIEKLSHGEPTWFTGDPGRVFAMFDNHHHGAAHISVYLPTPPELQRALVAAEPERYWVPPYVGHKGWVAIILDEKPDWAAVAVLAREAFARVATPARRR
jgi:hypothetical protein